MWLFVLFESLHRLNCVCVCVSVVRWRCWQTVWGIKLWPSSSGISRLRSSALFRWVLTCSNQFRGSSNITCCFRCDHWTSDKTWHRSVTLTNVCMLMCGDCPKREHKLSLIIITSVMWTFSRKWCWMGLVFVHVY